MTTRGWHRLAALVGGAALAASAITAPASAEEPPIADPAPTSPVGLPPEGTTDQLIITTAPGVSDSQIEAVTERAAADLGADVTADVRVLAIDANGRGPWSDSTTARIRR